jgi:DUF1680 family protein
MLSWRLLLQDGDPRYADLIERTLLNAVMASPREDGRAFFYTNTLHQRTDGVAPDEDELNARALSSLRAPWFEVSCCPTNVARTLASVESTFATTTADGLQLHQYGDYDVDTTLADGTPVAVSVRSGYPYAGGVTVTWRGDAGREVDLDLRIPSWAGSAVVGGPDATPSTRTGRATTVRRAFRAGDVVTVEFPVEARWVTPDPRIDAVRGQVAVQRGPLVMALESTDLPDGDVNDVAVDTTVDPVTTDRGATVTVSRVTDAVGAWPYGSGGADRRPLGPVGLVPYATWANRGPSTMRVWLPVAEEAHQG